MLAQVTDLGSNNITMANKMHAQFLQHEENLLDSDTLPVDSYTWNPTTDYARCFLHKVSSTVKGGLEELGRAAPSRTQEREDLLGLFPFSGTLPVIAEEDEDSEDNNSSTPIHIELPEEDNKAPEEVETDHDSADEDPTVAAPEYDENTENQKDNEDPTVEITPGTSKYHTSGSQKKANQLNALISKANFISRWVARSAAWRRHYSRRAKSMNLKVLPLTPGYNATRWNAEFDSLNQLVQARKVVNKLLADDLDLVKMKKHQKGNMKPRGYFHEIFFTPADWSTLEELTTELAPFLDFTKRMEGDGPTGCLVIPEFYALKVHLASQVEELSLGDALLPMIRSMQARVDKYFDEALQCDTTVMATLLNPFFWLQFFEQAFGLEHKITRQARKLLQDKFNARKTKQALTAPPVQTQPKQVPNKSNKTGPGNLFQLFKAHDPKAESNKIAAYLKGTHPMASNDDARKTEAVLPWWRVHCAAFPILASLAKDYLSLSVSSAIVERTFSAAADICSSDRVRLVPRTIEYCVGSRLWWRQRVPLGHKYKEANEAIEAFGGRRLKK